jgi:penicillin-binding protein 1C
LKIRDLFNRPPINLRRLAGGFLMLFFCFFLLDQLLPLPVKNVGSSLVVTDMAGEPLRAFAGRGGLWRDPVVDTSEVSPLYIQALLTYEDRWFFLHPGVNPFSLLRSAWQGLVNGRIISGGSTLTMQVARILEPHSRTALGKLTQIFRALQLEFHHSKDEILKMYLNHAPFGGPLLGIKAASHAYLGKAPDRLSYAEAAMLAVLPQAPTLLRPDRNPVKAQAGRDHG